MGLRAVAAADNRAILEDTAGFGWPITVTDPAGTIRSLTGSAGDISQSVDPSTGQLVTGRTAQVTLSLAALTAAGLGIPKGTSDGAGKPWLVQFNDPAGTSHLFKVSEALPDRALGCVLLSLEAYKP